MRTFIAMSITWVIVVGSLSAQPAVTVHRLVNNWPFIEVYYTASCDGTHVYNLDSTQIHITENGMPVTTYSQSCPDPSINSPISISLVLDASGSMYGAANAGVRKAFGEFVRKLDGVQDEAGVVYFSSFPWTALGMTHDTAAIRRAVEELPVLAMTTIWDGIYMGILQADSGKNSIRSVIVITDGGDGSSSHTPQDIVMLAQKRGIRVFTIGLGSIDPTNLSIIAMLTGGKYYSCPNTDFISKWLEDIYTQLRGGFYECSASYDATQLCPDVRLRRVELAVSDLCGGTASVSKTYSVYGPWTIARKPAIWFDTLSTAGNDTASVRLWAATDSVMDIPPAEFRISYNPSEMTYLEADFSGSIFEPTPPTIIPAGGSLLLSTTTPTSISGTHLLGAFTFVRHSVSVESSVLTIDSVSTAPVCFRSITKPGIISFSPQPPVFVHGDTVLCKNDTILLSAPVNMTDYTWTTGETGRFKYATMPGTYSYTAKTDNGLTVVSAEITLAPTPYPDVTIINVHNDTVNVCADDLFALEASPGYVSYDWGFGKQGERFYYPSYSARYSVSATDSCGCFSASKQVYFNHPPVYLVTPSCKRSGDTLIFMNTSGPWQWYFNGNPIPGETGNRLIMHQDGEYYVEARYFDSCTAVSNTFSYTSTGITPVPDLPTLIVNVYPNPSVDGSVILVSGATAQHVRYELYDVNGALIWYRETDEVSPAFPVMPPGIYLLRARQGEAFGYTKVAVR